MPSLRRRRRLHPLPAQAAPRGPFAAGRAAAGLHWPLLIAELVAASAAVAAITLTTNEPTYEVAVHLAVALGILASFLGLLVGRSPAPVGTAVMLAAFGLYAIRQNWVGGVVSLAYPTEVVSDEELGLATLIAWFLVGFCFLQSRRANLIFVFVPGLTIFGLVATRNLDPELVAAFLVFLLASLYAWGYDHFIEVAGAHPAARDWRRWARAHVPGAVLIFSLAIAGGCLLGNALYYTTPRFYTGFGIQQRVINSSGAHVQGYFMMLQQFDLGGGPIRLSQEPVLKVKAESASLWRGRSFDYYDGHGWTRTMPYSSRAVRTEARTYDLRLLRRLNFAGFTGLAASSPPSPGPASMGMPGAGLPSTSPPWAGLPAGRPVPQAPQGEPPGAPYRVPGPLQGPLLRQDIEILGSTTSAVLAAPYPVRLRLGPSKGIMDIANAVGVSVDPYGGVQTGAMMEPGQTYTVWSRIPSFPPGTLRKAPSGPWDAQTRDQYISQVSYEVRARLLPVVEEITAGASNDYDRARAIQRYLEERCAYTLNVPLTPAGRDPVVNFVLHSRRGACDLFASAMTLMCRLAGIPARVATGFAPGTYDPAQDAIIVRGTDAHAWSEVLFKDVGWVPFDPAAERSLEGQTLADLLRTGQWRLILEQIGRGLLSALIVLLAAYVGATALVDLRPTGRALLRRLRPARPLTRATDEGIALLRLLTHRAGLTYTPAMTPRECLSRLSGSPRGELLMPLLGDLRLAFDRLYALRFSQTLDQGPRRAEALGLVRDLRGLHQRIRRLRP